MQSVPAALLESLHVENHDLKWFEAEHARWAPYTQLSDATLARLAMRSARTSSEEEETLAWKDQEDADLLAFGARRFEAKVEGKLMVTHTPQWASFTRGFPSAGRYGILYVRVDAALNADEWLRFVAALESSWFHYIGIAQQGEA